MILLSIPGTIRMVLIIIAIFVIIRFISRLMATNKSAVDEKRFNQNNDSFKRAKEKGKVHIVEGGYREAEDVDFEEIKDDEKKDEKL